MPDVNDAGAGRHAVGAAAACLWMLVIATPAAAAGTDPVPMQRVGNIEIDRTEVTIGAFARFVKATGAVTAAERAGGGSTYEGGWVKRAGWTWRAPYGTPGADDEPVVHVDHAEATAYCHWAGKRLPTDAEWGEAAYTERRETPTDGFETGRTYRYPTGDTPAGANCLGDCPPAPAVAHADTSRGRGHAPVGATARGVNGLFDMGANVWEWVAQDDTAMPRTRGGSWWYGAQMMTDAHVARKPANMSAVYIGFRCVRDAGG